MSTSCRQLVWKRRGVETFAFPRFCSREEKEELKLANCDTQPDIGLHYYHEIINNEAVFGGDSRVDAWDDQVEFFLYPLWSHVTRNHTIAGARNEVISSFRIKRSCFLRPVFCSFPFGLEMMFAFHLSRVNKAARAFACEKLHSTMRFPSLSSSFCLLLVLRLLPLLSPSLFSSSLFSSLWAFFFFRSSSYQQLFPFSPCVRCVQTNYCCVAAAVGGASQSVAKEHTAWLHVFLDWQNSASRCPVVWERETKKRVRGNSEMITIEKQASQSDRHKLEAKENILIYKEC